MKAAFYIEDGVEQIVLTPESDLEKQLLKKLYDKRGRELQIYRGEFYACQGGWHRWSKPHPVTSLYHTDYDRDESTIFVLTELSEAKGEG